MSKKSNIRWRSNDVEQIERAIKNFNAKIYRTKRNHPELIDYLPNTIKKGDVIKSINTRADFNRTIKSLQRFSKRGAEKPVESSKGAKATKWEIDEFSHKQRIENARRTRERKAYEAQAVKSRGTPTDTKRREMGTVRENELKPLNKKFDKLSDKEWELAKSHIDKVMNENYRNEKRQIMKDNYIKGLQSAGYPDDLIEMVKSKDLDEFIETINNDTEASFDFIYDPLEMQVKSDALRDVWKGDKQ